MGYVLENALLNLGKNKGRNILLGIVIFAVITAAAVALTIYNTTGVIIEDTKEALLCAVRVGPQKRVAGGSNLEASVSMEQYRYFGESAYLDSADIKASGGPDGVEAVYYLKQPNMLASFEAEIRDKGLPADYTVRTDESLFEQTAGAVESLNGIALTFLIIVLALGATIVVLLSVISIRERKYEIGVLRAMGMKKKNVAIGLWAELIAITCLCFALGMGAGAVLTQPVSDMLLAGQTQYSTGGGSTTLAERLGETTGQDGNNQAKADVSMDASTVLEIFGLAIGLASVAGVVSVGRITKYEPIRILTRRE